MKKKVPFKVSCFKCHSNGPRVIRANYNSKNSPTTTLGKIIIAFWNFKIKSYGLLIEDKVHKKKDRFIKVAFKTRSKFIQKKLLVKTCLKCHNNSGFIKRGFLTREHIPTIKFMIKKGYMPPMGFKLSRSEKIELQSFLMGF